MNLAIFDMYCDKQRVELPARTRLLSLIDALNQNNAKNGSDKVKEVYEYARNIGFSPIEARQLIEDCLLVSKYHITKHIPEEAKRLRRRTPGRFFPSRSKIWQ